MAKRVVKENSERHQAYHTEIAPSKTPFISFCWELLPQSAPILCVKFSP